MPEPPGSAEPMCANRLRLCVCVSNTQKKGYFTKLTKRPLAMITP